MSLGAVGPPTDSGYLFVPCRFGLQIKDKESITTHILKQQRTNVLQQYKMCHLLSIFQLSSLYASAFAVFAFQDGKMFFVFVTDLQNLLPNGHPSGSRLAFFPMFALLVKAQKFRTGLEGIL